MKNDSALFYTCSLIEFIGRRQKQKRAYIVNALGKNVVKRIYTHSDVLHCEVIDSVAEEFINMRSIKTGDFDNVSKCKYAVPDYWTIGEVYERLIEDVQPDEDVDNIIETLFKVYNSWVSDSICRFNTDFYYQSRDYIKECFLTNQQIA